MISLSQYHGRFVNHFFRNMAVHFVAEKANISVQYGYTKEFAKMGICFFSGVRTYNPTHNTLLICENNFMTIMDYPEIHVNNLTEHGNWYQTREFSLKLHDYFNQPAIKQKVVEANPHASRYGTNNDVFVHVRLGDVPQLTPGFGYYDKVLSSLTYDNGYISSDTIDHPICKQLIDKYGLTVIDTTPEETIQFASTCRHQVLSQGTFSWMMALLGYNTECSYYPKIKRVWHGDIFVLPCMQEVDY